MNFSHNVSSSEFLTNIFVVELISNSFQTVLNYRNLFLIEILLLLCRYQLSFGGLEKIQLQGLIGAFQEARDAIVSVN